MTRLIQICASENDLFGLDGDGMVYHYNFGTNDWMRLGNGRRDRTAVPPGPARPAGPAGSDATGPGEGRPGADR